MIPANRSVESVLDEALVQYHPLKNEGGILLSSLWHNLI